LWSAEKSRHAEFDVADGDPQLVRAVFPGRNDRPGVIDNFIGATVVDTIEARGRHHLFDIRIGHQPIDCEHLLPPVDARVHIEGVRQPPAVLAPQETVVAQMIAALADHVPGLICYLCPRSFNLH
jgi:hypothetical protein